MLLHIKYSGEECVAHVNDFIPMMDNNIPLVKYVSYSPEYRKVKR